MGCCTSSTPVRVIPVANAGSGGQDGTGKKEAVVVRISAEAERRASATISRALGVLAQEKKRDTREMQQPPAVTEAVIKKLAERGTDQDDDGGGGTDDDEAKPTAPANMGSQLDTKSMDEVIKRRCQPVRRGSRRVSMTPLDTAIYEEQEENRKYLAIMRVVASRGRRVSAVPDPAKYKPNSPESIDIYEESETCIGDSPEPKFRRLKARHRMSIAEKGSVTSQQRSSSRGNKRFSVVSQLNHSDPMSPQSSDEEFICSTFMNASVESMDSVDSEFDDIRELPRRFKEAPLSRRNTVHIY